MNGFRIQGSGFRVGWIAAFFILAAATCAAPGNEIRFERQFADAARAYDENRVPEAIAGWEALLNEGQIYPEVLFNLGNAYYRNGNIGQAIRAYRHAQTLAPRDPDIRANLGFAAQTAGIALPVRPPIPALLLEVSQTEWRRLGSGCFWLFVLALAAWILWPRFRFATRPAAIILSAMLLVALGGLWMQRELRRIPECVVMTDDHKVRSGPLESATPILSVAEGTIVRRLDQRGNWMEIQFESTRGWLPADAVVPVL
jgi:hypothetical protein